MTKPNFHTVQKRLWRPSVETYTKDEVEALFYELRHMFLDKKHNIYVERISIVEFASGLKSLIGKNKLIP